VSVSLRVSRLAVGRELPRAPAASAGRL